jgi:hypothetical protein
VGGDAFVVPPAGPIAEVDLATMKVRRHELRESRSLLKGTTGPVRTALALGNGLLAVTGWNYGVVAGRPQAVPAGLELVNPRTWRFQPLAPDVSTIELADGLLLAHADGATAGGLIAYALRGRLLYRLFSGRAVYLATTIGDTGYADIGGNAGERERTVRFDLRTGKLGRPLPHPLPDLLQGDSAPFAAAGF